jgi:hypothetical protein
MKTLVQYCINKILEFQPKIGNLNTIDWWNSLKIPVCDIPTPDCCMNCFGLFEELNTYDIITTDPNDIIGYFQLFHFNRKICFNCMSKMDNKTWNIERFAKCPFNTVEACIAATKNFYSRETLFKEEMIKVDKNLSWFHLCDADEFTDGKHWFEMIKLHGF